MFQLVQRSLWYALILGLVISLAVGSPTGMTSHAQEEKQVTSPLFSGVKGISVVLYNNDSTMGVNAPQFFDDLEARQLGIESIILTFPIFQDNASSTDLYADPLLTPSEESLRIIVREANERGICIWLKPLLDDSRLGENKWRGSITPGGNLDDLTALDAWFASYWQLLSVYARIAQEENACGLVVGTEFVSIDKDLPKYNQRWLNLITQVRSVFSGKISYAMNWNPHEVPGFVMALDVLMIDAFYDLQELPDYASEEGIFQAWHYWAANIRTYKSLGIPVMFAEVGVVPRVGSYRSPWNSNNGGTADFRSQYSYYRATCRFAQQEAIDGMYWWAVGFYDFFENQYDRYVRDGTLTFTFYDLPAEDAVRECYVGR